MDEKVLLLLIGAGISFVSGITALLLQHFLSLRIDKITRKRDRIDRDLRELRDRLTEDIDPERLSSLLGEFRGYGAQPVRQQKEALAAAALEALLRAASEPGRDQQAGRQDETCAGDIQRKPERNR